MRNMNELFLHFLKDMYYAENQTQRTLPQLLAAAQSQALKQAFELQAQSARAHTALLEKVFEAVGERPAGATCDALLGMVKEMEDLLKQTGAAGPIQDAGLIAGIQAIQHYAIARYGSLLAWATEMGQQQAMTALKQVLDASKEADATFSRLAVSEVNKAVTTA